MANMTVTINARDVPQVREELERMQHVIAAAEWSASDCCPWCGNSRERRKYGNGRPIRGTGEHEADCMAFSSVGVVR